MKQLRNGSIQSSVLITALVALALLEFSPAYATTETSPRERISFDDDWRFTKGEPEGISNKLAYGAIKDWVEATGAQFTTNASLLARPRPIGNPDGVEPACAQNSFDDTKWQRLNLPHDWGVEGPFKFEYPGDTGKLPWWGIAWYRKHFTVSDSDKGRQIYLDVDGAMAYATVWLNGKFVGGWPYGYASWRVDLTPYIHFGGENVVAIRLDNPPNSSRWYPGGGIYRNVWLVKTSPVHVGQWGTYITTPEATAKKASVRIQVTVANDSDRDATVNVKDEVFELRPDGKHGRAVATIGTDGVLISAGKSVTTRQQFDFFNPRLWSLRNPQRYVDVTSVTQDGRLTDVYETPFGVRTIEFNATNGFVLNGERVPLDGVCDHHDLGALGAALNTRALERQLQELQEMGCNAIRTSHNPPAPELLDLCDRLGMLVMDESFDCWRRSKTRNDYHLLFDDWHEKDWRAELRRDRNHPSIILWSIGNEISEQSSAAGHLIAGELTRIAHEEDPTRPTTAACNIVQSGYNGFEKEVDVFGYNYKPDQYARFHAANPTMALFGSETASCVSSRGIYLFPVSSNKAGGKGEFQMSSYDLYAPPWATPPDWEFAGQDRNRFVAGEFVWTGWDYLGEPTPFNSDLTNLLNVSDPAERARLQDELTRLGKIRSPSRSSYFGIIDLAGFKKDRFYLYQARWRPELRMAHILPHWNWPDRVGQVTPVHVYTSGDSAELFLNGKSLGRKQKGRYEYRLHWDDVIYQPGELNVVAYQNGKKWATDTVKTTGSAAKLTLKADRSRITADGRDLSFITATVMDANGLMVPTAKNHIHFEVEGPGEVVATDNGDATSFEPFQAPEHDAFNGLCLAIVRGEPGKAGTIKITAKSDGLNSASLSVHTRANN